MKLLILDSTVASGRFVDRGDIVDVPPQIARDLLNERKATASERAIAAREAEQAAAAPRRERAAARPKTEKAAIESASAE